MTDTFPCPHCGATEGRHKINCAPVPGPGPGNIVKVPKPDRPTLEEIKEHRAAWLADELAVDLESLPAVLERLFAYQGALLEMVEERDDRINSADAALEFLVADVRARLSGREEAITQQEWIELLREACGLLHGEGGRT